jgi:hypothetical protein
VCDRSAALDPSVVLPEVVHPNPDARVGIERINVQFTDIEGNPVNLTRLDFTEHTRQPEQRTFGIERIVEI